VGKEKKTSFEVDRNLWKEVRKYAIEHGITMRELIEFLLKKELKDNLFLKEMEQDR